MGWVGLGVRSEATVASSSAFEFGNRGVEVGFAEVGPEFWRDVEFGVAELPEEKIGEAHFTGRADEQVRIGPFCGVEVALEVGLGELFGV